MEGFWQRLAKEDYIRFDQAITRLPNTVRNFLCTDHLLHSIVRILGLALNTPLGGKGTMGLDYLVCRNASLAFQAIYVLTEQFEQSALFVE